MKTRIFSYFAIVATLVAAPAYGQYMTQPSGPMSHSRGIQSVQPNGMTQQSIVQNAAHRSGPTGTSTSPGYGIQGAALGSNPCATGSCGSGNRGCSDCGRSPGYLSIFGGATIFEDTNLNLGLAAPGDPVTDIDAILDTDDGWAIGGAVGRNFSQRLRGEFEFTYRNAAFNSAGIVLNGAPQGATPVDGQINQYATMTNFLFDLNPCGTWNMYGGGGTGAVFNDLDVNEPNNLADVRLQSSAWAYQGIVGVSRKLRSSSTLFLEYRYFGTAKLEIDAATVIGSASADVDIASNNVFIGLRFRR